MKAKTKLEQLVTDLNIDIFDVCDVLGIRRADFLKRISGGGVLTQEQEEQFKKFLSRALLIKPYPVMVYFMNKPSDFLDNSRGSDLVSKDSSCSEKREFRSLKEAIGWAGEQRAISTIGIFVQLEEPYEICYQSESVSADGWLQGFLAEN